MKIDITDPRVARMSGPVWDKAFVQALKRLEPKWKQVHVDLPRRTHADR